VLAVRAGTTTSVLRPTIAGCLLVLVAAALEGCAVAGPDRAADVRRNERLLTDVPPYPGARVDGTTSARERDPESGALADNYTTIRTELLSTRIPLRLAHCRENPYHLLTDWVRESEPQERVRHEVERQLDLVASIGAKATDLRLSFALTDDDRRAALAKLSDAGVDVDRPWLTIHPGASAPSRRYPAERFARVARELAERLDCQIVLTGDATESALAESVRADAGSDVWSVAGALELNELGALIAMSPLLISNNTGPVHIAAALGTPVVDLYALTNPQHTPWQVLHRVLYHDVPCKNCYRSVCPMGHHACLRGVDVATVVAAAVELWQTRVPIKRNSKPHRHDHPWHQRRLPRLRSLHRA